MSEHSAEKDAWFPDDQHGYSVAICRCEEGPYLGARKMGTPCRCERCGFMTQEQFDFLTESLFAAAAAAWRDEGRGVMFNRAGDDLSPEGRVAKWLRSRGGAS